MDGGIRFAGREWDACPRCQSPIGLDVVGMATVFDPEGLERLECGEQLKQLGGSASLLIADIEDQPRCRRQGGSNLFDELDDRVNVAAKCSPAQLQRGEVAATNLGDQVEEF